MSSVICHFRNSTSLNSNTADRNCLFTTLTHLLGKTIINIKTNLEAEDILWRYNYLPGMCRPGAPSSAPQKKKWGERSYPNDWHGILFSNSQLWVPLEDYIRQFCVFNTLQGFERGIKIFFFWLSSYHIIFKKKYNTLS